MPYKDKEKQKEYQQKWSRKKYLDNKDEFLERAKEWKKNNREKCDTHNLTYKIKCPWNKFFSGIKERCNNKTHRSYKGYGGKGIRCLITSNELKELWFRDKAYNLKRPSIDRKDSNKDYIFYNCQFIELSENVAKSNRERKIKRDLLRLQPHKC